MLHSWPPVSYPRRSQPGYSAASASWLPDMQSLPFSPSSLLSSSLVSNGEWPPRSPTLTLPNTREGLLPLPCQCLVAGTSLHVHTSIDTLVTWSLERTACRAGRWVWFLCLEVSGRRPIMRAGLGKWGREVTLSAVRCGARIGLTARCSCFINFFYVYGWMVLYCR